MTNHKCGCGRKGKNNGCRNCQGCPKKGGCGCKGCGKKKTTTRAPV